MKLLVWIAVAVIFGLWLLQKKRSRSVSGGERPEDAGKRRQPALVEPERMLPCARCGVHVPASEALLAGDEAYCCIEHKAQRTSSTQASR
ncbi:MAG: hypothetical protein JWR21_1430 [Herminiimonas sp.]|nr:hypothetical protein [Herminiimonas sp.]